MSSGKVCFCVVVFFFFTKWSILSFLVVLKFHGKLRRVLTRVESSLNFILSNKCWFIKARVLNYVTRISSV